MTLKCTVFGHRWGDPEVDREREEDGSEVIITIREKRACERCGDVQIVSQNKEVTTLETAADIVSEDLDGEAAGETEATASAPADGHEGGGSAEGDGPTPGEVSDPSEDDGVILDEDSDEGQQEAEEGRGRGEWPAEPETDDGGIDHPVDIESVSVGTSETRVETTDSAVTVPEGEYYCPECSYTTPVESSSLREGDFCPDCHKGALEQRDG